ncbi:MAG: BREX system P-loop protein BrxC [Clostridiaceae bacterium]|jgi:hypothetical protein|nr:BREX system P-loop protein BrxC [Clostridiaceae bacterium]
MTTPDTLFLKDVKRKIDTVIKADDQANVFQEVDEYVITREISNKLASFFETYKDKGPINGVWISGFFGSGKSHLLKILSYVLENKEYNGYRLGEMFTGKVIDDRMLRADIDFCLANIKSESILFNIDQQAQITNRSDESALLKVFYKVFYDHQGFYGFQPHVAAFEESLFFDNYYETFKQEFEKHYGQAWVEVRKDYIKPQINEAIAQTCSIVYNDHPEKYKDYLFKWQSQYKQSIEDFSYKVSQYILAKGPGFRLNFFVDEVGQFIAERTKLMLNLQTLAETLHTKCGGNSWIFVTSQEDLENLVGDDSRVQSDDFSKIQGRFKVRIPLTSSSVDEVIEKRLLTKNEQGTATLTRLYEIEKENVRTLFSFSKNGIQFRHYQSPNDFVNKYPFLPYQFDLFQQCIKSLSRHNVFQGQHQSVGERSMLGVFQQILKDINLADNKVIVSFDQMYEGIAGTLRSEAQNSLLLADRNLRSVNPMAIRVLKVLFLIKYYDSFKATARNLSVLLIDNLNVNLTTHNKSVEEALALLEQQSYIHVKGNEYEYLTDVEKDVEVEIKDMSIDNVQITQFINELIFDGIIRENKIRYAQNGQEFEYSRKVDGILFNREKELKIDIITPNHDNYNFSAFYTGNTLADHTLMMVRLPPDKRLIYEVRLYLQTEKYIRQAQSLTGMDMVARIRIEKGQQNVNRKQQLQTSLNTLLADATIYLNGIENKSSTSRDGRNRIFEAAQDLIQLAYPKLVYLSNVTLDERQLHSIMTGEDQSLFSQDPTILKSAENEILNLLERRKIQMERTSLSDLKEHFSKKPYGWSTMAIWCLVALLFKRGKVEARETANLLSDNELLDAFNNNRSWLSTLIAPQVELKREDINLLKQLYQDIFDESNPHIEGREAALLFKTTARNREQKIRDLLKEAERYPFLKNLGPMAKQLNTLATMDYVTLIESIRDYTDELVMLKNTTYDPIMQVWNSGQKKIYDHIYSFYNDNKANFEYVDVKEREIIVRLLKDQTPYKGHSIREAKEAMDSLERVIQTRIHEEQQSLTKLIRGKMEKIQASNEFREASDNARDTVIQRFEEVLFRAQNQTFIANLNMLEQSITELYTRQLNVLVSSKPQATLQGGDESPQPQVKYMTLDELKQQVRIAKHQIESLQDIEEYLQVLKEALEEKIKEDYKIILN